MGNVNHGRRGQGRHDNISGGGRQAHTDDQAGKGGYHNHDINIPAGYGIDNLRDEAPQAHGYHADNDAGGGSGKGHGNHVSAACGKA